MTKKSRERGRGLLLVLVAGSLLAMLASALPVAADDAPEANAVRTLPYTVVPGEEFEVTVSFTAPADGFGSITLRERAPAGWTVSVDKAWCDPEAGDAIILEPNDPGYQWFTEHEGGTEFTATYRVLVPVDAELGEYTFENELFQYHIDENDEVTGPFTEEVGGRQTVTVTADSGRVDLRAHTPKPTGCIQLIKLFDPDDTEFLHDQIEVRITGPDDFDETYTLRAGDAWEKVICDLELGTYTVEELDPVPGWIPTYDPADRQLTVTEATEPGPGATMTITSTRSIIGISVSPSEMDFGEIAQGETATGVDITVTNTGNVNIDIDVILDDDTAYNDDGDLFYTAALMLNGVFSDRHDTPTALGAWPALLEYIAPDGTEDVTTALACPGDMFADTEYTGTLIFWAEESGG